MYNKESEAYAELSSLPAVSAESAVVMNSDGEILFSKNADEKRLIASTTKIMTAIVVLENCELNETVRIPAECCGIEGSSMYLKAGEEYTVLELLYGLMLVSGNDAASALALHASNTEESFVELMNSKAKSLGMNSTFFANPHGLDEEGHFSTAKDLAKLMCYCMENEAFAEIAGSKSVNLDGQTLVNHNKLQTRLPGCIGGKTGYTEAAGRCLVSCCEREGTRFICVSLSAPDDWNDHIKLYTWAFSNYSSRLIFGRNTPLEIPVLAGKPDSIKAVVEEDLCLLLPKDTDIEVVIERPAFVFAPVKAGDRAGRIIVLSEGQKLAEKELFFKESAVPVGRVCLTRYILEPV